MPKEKTPTFNAEYVRDISVEVYKERLGKKDTERLISDPDKGPEYLRKNAQFYDPQVVACLRAVNDRNGLELGLA